LFDEMNKFVPKGSKIRIVAITPKVYKRKILDKERDDGYDYFYNAVRAEESDYWEKSAGQHTEKPLGKRIRANFVTIS
jgi:hypothetical protein